MIWGQHETDDVEVAGEVFRNLAEDTSYKLWEIINNMKTYTRHCGSTANAAIINEVMRDSDVPPVLGCLHSDWDRIDYNGSCYFYADKVVELRDEYQRDVSIKIMQLSDFAAVWPIEDGNMEFLKTYLPSIIYASLYGNNNMIDDIINEIATSPIIRTCYRVILAKLIQILAFKQNDEINIRCWNLMRAITQNPCVRGLYCQEEYYHLSEILICQLLAPYETIRSHIVNANIDQNIVIHNELNNESAEMNKEYDKILLPLKVSREDRDVTNRMSSAIYSPYFTNPVGWKCVDDLCQTIGQMSSVSAIFHNECLLHIMRRLKLFFAGRAVKTERDFNYISRAIRGLISLGEYAFREFIPYIYQLEADNVPESNWSDFASAAVFLKGFEDIFLYEWLSTTCGADKLQPFMIYYTNYHEKLLLQKLKNRKTPTYRILPKIIVRRLEWSTLAAAMCHGDDPNKALKPKPTINDYFPEIQTSKLSCKDEVLIQIKFAGFRGKVGGLNCNSWKQVRNNVLSGVEHFSSPNLIQKDVVIAKRKLLKSVTNECRALQLSTYHLIRI